MKIVQVLPRYAPAWAYGGGVRMFWLLATELAKRGHQVHAITSDSLGPGSRTDSLREVLAPGVEVHRYRNRFNRLSAYLPAAFYRPREMRGAIRRELEDAAVVHMGESRGIHNLWSAQAAEAASVPLIWSAFGGLPAASGVRGAYRRLHDLVLTDQVVPRVAAFIAQTDHEEKVYREHGAAQERIHQIPLCVDLANLGRPIPKGAFRRRLGLAETDQLVVSVARLAPVKGLELLVEAFAEVRPNGRGPHLALVGWDHGSLDGLKRLASRRGIVDRVHFPGPLYEDERLTAYLDADVFALAPRVFEETSLAALEAAALGCPTVLTAECEIPGLVLAGGGTVTEREPVALAAALRELLGDPELRASTGARASAFVAAHFSSSAVAVRHEALFQALAL